MIPSPYAVQVHPYPTRFHGGIWTRPVFGLPYVPAVHAVFTPNQLSSDPAFGELTTTTAAVALGAFAIGVAGAVYWFSKK